MGTSSVGTVTLDTAAPAGGAVVALASSGPAAVTDPSVVVPQGATSARFVVDTTAVTTATPVTIQATYKGVTFSAALTVLPRAPVRGTAGDSWADVVIGQPDFSQITIHEVTSARLYSPGGVTVDRSVRPNRIYVYDGGNSRILGLSHLGTCQSLPTQNCTASSDCGTHGPCSIQEGIGADQPAHPSLDHPIGGALSAPRLAAERAWRGTWSRRPRRHRLDTTRDERASYQRERQREYDGRRCGAAQCGRRARQVTAAPSRTG
jgi:hypothetical protein